uniref:Uncharacterized protein n=1 Tax=Timema bartmani TaxID=61472 RepID=A0A7R9I7C7_9NEOP|nr:unnamed protein product [Timema bartmani]
MNDFPLMLSGYKDNLGATNNNVMDHMQPRIGQASLRPKYEAHQTMVSPGLVEDTPATNQQSILDEDRESSTRIG